MKYLLFTIAIVISMTSYCQEKKTYYFTEDSKSISEEEFKHKYSLDEYISKGYEIDTAKIYVIFERKQYGKLDSKKYQELLDFLEESTNSNMLPEGNIIINYLTPVPVRDDGTGRQTSNWNIFHRNYLKNLLKAGKFSQYWVAHPEQESLKYFHGDRIHWIIDSENLVKRHFFLHSFHYGSFVIINHTGTYIKYYGEYGKQTVIEVAAEIDKL